MFTKEEIVARMKKGEDLDTIANEMAEVLNEASKQVEIDRIKEEEKREEEEKARAAWLEREAQLASLADIIIDSIKNYIIVADPELKGVIEAEEFEGDVFREVIDNTIPLLKTMVQIEAVQKEKSKPSTMEVKLKPDLARDTDTDIDVDKILKAWVKII